MSCSLNHGAMSKELLAKRLPSTKCPECSATIPGWMDIVDDRTLGDVLREAILHAETHLQILNGAAADNCISNITLSKKLRGASLVTFATMNLTPGEVLNNDARYVGVVVWVPRVLWPK